MLKLLFKDYIKHEENYHIADLVFSVGQHTQVHWHDYYEFFTVLAGSFEYEHNGRRFAIGPGYTQLVRPCDQHTFLSTREGVNVSRNISIDRNYFEHRLAEAGQGIPDGEIPGFYLDAHALKSYTDKTDLMFSWQIDSERFQLIGDALLFDFLVHCHCRHAEASQMPKWLSHCLAKMLEPDNYIAGLTRMVGLSGHTQEYLTRSMRVYCRTTPTAYIKQVRINAAMTQLRESDISVTDIAFGCGFNNLSYFNRSFKAANGLSPHEYRKNSRGSYDPPL